MRRDNKTVAVTLRFYTNDLEVVVNQKSVLACWDCGSASLEANKEKGIKAGQVHINSLDDIQPALKELLRKAKIHMVSPNKRPRVLSAQRRKL